MSEVIPAGEAIPQQATPMTLISMAVQQGQSVEQLQKLFELQLRYEANEARKAYVTALTAFKQNPPKIGKNKQVDFTGNTGKRTQYKHATLDNVCDVIGAALAMQGLSYRWRTDQQENGLIRVYCTLTHVLGHSEEVWLQAGRDDSGNKNAIQAVVSTVTYLERQTLLSATGMAVSNQDDDGRQGKTGMTEEAKADWLAAIDALTDATQVDALWKRIAEQTTAAKDVVTHDELRAALNARVKALKTQAKVTL